MIHKQFEYRRKLIWAVLFLIVFFSTASSMMKKEKGGQKNDAENVCPKRGNYGFSVIAFLNE